MLSTLQDRSAANNVIGASGPGTAAESAVTLAHKIPRAIGSGLGALVGAVGSHALGLPEVGDLGLAALGMKAGDAATASIQARNASALARLLLNPQEAAKAIQGRNQPSQLAKLLQQSPQGRALLASPQLQVLMPAVAGSSSRP